VQKKRVQVAPDGAEALVENGQELHDILDLSGGKLPVSRIVGLLVLLAEYLQLGEGLRGLIVVGEHPFETCQPAELHEKTACKLRCLRLAGEQDLVQHFLRIRQLPLTDLVEEGEDIFFLGVIDVLLHAVQLDRRVGAKEQGKPLALHPHVTSVVLHHVQDVLHRQRIDGDLFLPEKSGDPALLLIVEHFPEDLLILLGNGSRDLPVDLPRKAGAYQDEGRILCR